MFGLLKKIGSAAGAAAVTEIKGANGENTDALEAACAAAALAAAGDGEATADEKKRATEIVKRHRKLGAIYRPADIEKMMEAMFELAQDSSGRQQLARELTDIAGKDNMRTMCEDCYNVAKDVCTDPRSGEIDEKEQVQLGKIARVLKVDPSALDF